MLAKVFLAFIFLAVSVYGVVLTWGAVALNRVLADPLLVQEENLSESGLSQVVEPWLSVPGLQSLARPLDLRLADVDDPDQLHAKLEQSLRVTPAASGNWLLLAHVRRARGEAPEAVGQALEYSIITGRYELSTMIRRVEFGLMAWPELAPDLQQQIVTELSLTGPRLNRTQVQALKGRLDEMAQADRDAVAASLAGSTGPQATRWMRALGLETSPSPGKTPQ